jgi:hypothetical protein
MFSFFPRVQAPLDAVCSNPGVSGKNRYVAGRAASADKHWLSGAAQVKEYSPVYICFGGNPEEPSIKG